jgi:hypothetical protein
MRSGKKEVKGKAFESKSKYQRTRSLKIEHEIPSKEGNIVNVFLNFD